MSTLDLKRLIPLAPLLLIAIPVALAHPTQTEKLTLTAYIGKPVFFEDEPIFYALRLTNVGSDTAWVMDFGAISMAVQMSVRRDGEAVPVGGLWIDYMCMRDIVRCGEALPPGSSRLTAGILQERAGEERDFKRSLFPHHLGPGEYEVRVGTRGVEAAPITFRVRERSVNETRELRELEALRWMSWDRTGPTNYEGTLISWVARHQQDDPFLPFLLAQWLYSHGTIEALARQQANLDLDSLRVAVLQADRSSAAGAYIAQYIADWRPQQFAALAEPLGTSIAGEMARYLVDRMQRRKH